MAKTSAVLPPVAAVLVVFLSSCGGPPAQDAGVESQDGRWRVWAWGRNVTGKHYWNQVQHVNDVLLRYTGMPSMYGISLSLRTN